MMPQEEYQEEYEVVFHLPANSADAFTTVGDLTVGGFFWQVYENARHWAGQAEGEKLATIITVEGFPLGAFVLPFEDEEETPQMREMTVSEFYELLRKDWSAAFRILPANAHGRVDAFLASDVGL
jgi:hypothetical protein